MSYEVDFIGVGKDSSACGDAIVMRYGDFVRNPHEQLVVVVDGGYIGNGPDLVKHIRGYYETNRVDLVVSTHPDADHIGGLTVVVDEMQVGTLAMHLPWTHASTVRNLIQAGRVTEQGISRRFRESLQQAVDLEKLARSKGIPIIEPFVGQALTPGLHIVGPTREYYCELLADFDRGDAVTTMQPMRGLLYAAQVVRTAITESLHREALAEPPANAVTPRNNSGTVLLLDATDQRFLFTSDVGVPALSQALDLLAAYGIVGSSIGYIQIPHHGSKRNVGPGIMDRLFGLAGGQRTITQRGIISAPRDGSPKHPSQRVINAGVRRGAQVNVTRGRTICYHSPDVPVRNGWSSCTPESFVATYDEEDE